MNTLLRPEKSLEEWIPESIAERYKLDEVERILGNILTSLETTLPNALGMLRNAKWGGEKLCNAESLAVLTTQIETLRTQLVSALGPAYQEIYNRVYPPQGGGYDGPAWE